MSADFLPFSTLPISDTLVKNLDSLGYTAMTPIQSLALPPILSKKDIIAKAKTGSGKTTAFGIGILSALNTEILAPQGLILCPTRELADQVAEELRRLARQMHNVKIITLCGGVPIASQLSSLEHGAHIIIATPGRLADHLQRGSLDLNQLKIVVLDEADRMLDMGFGDDIKKILSQTPSSRQTLLFSATYPDSIQSISRTIQRNPEFIEPDDTHNENEIDQYFYEIDESQRNQVLAKLININPCESTIVFCNTKAACHDVAIYLNQRGFSAIALYGDLEQREREQVLLQFINKSSAILVATDVAARGLDIKALDLVINYQITPDPEVHIHRIGRTGRAGEKGLAITLVAANEIPRANMIEQTQTMSLKWQELENLTLDSNKIVHPKMQTLSLTIGKKNKIRPGDILGALTKDANIAAQYIGKIKITDLYSYVAVDKTVVSKILTYFQQGKIKGKTVRAKRL